MKKLLGLTAAALVLGVLAYNLFVAVVVARGLPAGHAVTIVAYHRWFVSPNTLVLDLWAIDGTTSMADVDACLIAAAAALADHDNATIVLAHRGLARFAIAGPDFRALAKRPARGDQFARIRDLQNGLTRMNGTRAFGAVAKGVPGGASRHLDDHSEFHAQWYLRDELGLPDGAPIG